MNSSSRHGLAAKVRVFFGRLKPHPLPVARKQRVLASVGAGLGLAITSLFSHWVLGEVNLWFVAPVGASAVLLFGVPNSPLAQPWSIVGGNFISALVGITVGMWIDNPALACGIAACLSIALMFKLHCLHPPGGAVALTAVLGGQAIQDTGYMFAFSPVLLNSVSLALLAILFNNLAGRRYPHPLAAGEPPPPPVAITVSITRSDLHEALMAGQLLDIDEDDLQEVLLKAEQIAERRQLNHGVS